MRDFVELNAPSLLEGWDNLIGFQESTNAWGWAKEGLAALFAVMLAFRAVAWAWRKARREDVGSFVLREFSGDGVAWIPELSRLETLKASCKYFTVGPNGLPNVEAVVVCGDDVTHLLTDRQKKKLRTLAASTIKKCRQDELARQQRLVLEKTRQKVYRQT